MYKHITTYLLMFPLMTLASMTQEQIEDSNAGKEVHTSGSSLIATDAANTSSVTAATNTQPKVDTSANVTAPSGVDVDNANFIKERIRQVIASANKPYVADSYVTDYSKIYGVKGKAVTYGTKKEAGNSPSAYVPWATRNTSTGAWTTKLTQNPQLIHDSITVVTALTLLDSVLAKLNKKYQISAKKILPSTMESAARQLSGLLKLSYWQQNSERLLQAYADSYKSNFLSAILKNCRVDLSVGLNSNDDVQAYQNCLTKQVNLVEAELKKSTPQQIQQFLQQQKVPREYYQTQTKTQGYQQPNNQRFRGGMGM
ncbi:MULTISPECIES: hypothetical protein [Cysteiniphilum]|uniref:hypothetical protein n=1 Tax=Cysteiniphilum TaxID=2056696 RepID=UPI00178730E9|nr:MULTISPECIES: hypothetical protein [Cysteiniphilum]